MFELKELELLQESLSIRCAVLADRTTSTTCLFTVGDAMSKHIDLYVLLNKIEQQIKDKAVNQ